MTIRSSGQKQVFFQRQCIQWLQLSEDNSFFCMWWHTQGKVPSQSYLKRPGSSFLLPQSIRRIFVGGWKWGRGENFLWRVVFRARWDIRTEEEILGTVSGYHGVTLGFNVEDHGHDIQKHLQTEAVITLFCGEIYFQKKFFFSLCLIGLVHSIVSVTPS